MLIRSGADVTLRTLGIRSDSCPYSTSSFQRILFPIQCIQLMAIFVCFQINFTSFMLPCLNEILKLFLGVVHSIPYAIKETRHGPWQRT
jgi:hypothetical protein